jgi:predicted GNAT family N-acyltransferase
MNLSILQHNTKAYDEMLDLRIRVLLNPIGVPATYINKEKEKDDILIGAYEKERLIGCCVLTKRNDTTVQLRQMAVDSALQSKGIGSAVVRFAEKIAREKGFSLLMMHARSEVVDFYLKNGYTIVGEPFNEVGIAHRIMQKELG